MTASLPSVTIIGFGAFGTLLAGLLAPHAQVFVYDRSAAACREAASLGLTVTGSACEISSDIVILAVPIQTLDQTLQEIAPHLRAGQLVVDVCSIKEEPARLMAARLPACVDILATHPMFGPQSARHGITGCQVVLCPVRGAGWRHVARFLKRRLRLDVIVTTPEDHDRQAAMTQGLTHLLAQAFATLGDKPLIRTRSFDLMSEALAMVAHDAPEIFEAVTQGNRHFTPLRAQLMAALAAPVTGER